MGEVYSPKDVIHGRSEKISDLTPTPVLQPTKSSSLGALLQEIKSMKVEIERIKRSLRAHGITVE